MGLFSFLLAKKDNSLVLTAMREGAFLIDVRTAVEFENGSLQAAVNIPLQKLAGSLPKFENKKKMIVFCKSGNRSREAKKILEKAGFQNVIDGGSWRNLQQIIES